MAEGMAEGMADEIDEERAPAASTPRSPSDQLLELQGSLLA